MNPLARLAALFLLPLASVALAAPKDDLDRLAKDHWEWQAREFPEFSTLRGDSRYDDRLTDHGEAAARKRRDYREDFLKRILAIDAAALTGQDRITYDILRTQAEALRRVNRIYASQPGDLPFGSDDNWLKLSPSGGVHRMLPLLARATTFRTEADYENYLKRLKAFPALLAQQRAWMERAAKAGYVAPGIAMRTLPAQIGANIGDDPAALPAYAPFKTFAADIPAAARERLAADARKVIAEALVPAFRALNDYVKNTYLPLAAARDADPGLTRLPAGEALYAEAAKSFTTTDMAPAAIHALGVSEVARIAKEMEKVIARTGFTGTREAFNEKLRTDPANFFTTREAMLGHYRDLAKRADAELPKFFAELPRQPYGIRPMDISLGDAAEHYTAGAADGTRAGFFEANANNLKTRPKHWMEAVLLHETVPGHHLQSARAQELKDLPEVRKFARFTAYGEGWGLYAESLGEEMGFYQDPYSKYGQLSAEMHRAARLVVDTGMHALGWSRDRTIRYLMDYAGLSEGFAVAETDRYLLMPGQALAYKVGELKIKALRAKAKAALGARFDLRRFHNLILDNGPLPLDILEKQVDAWVAGQK